MDDPRLVKKLLNHFLIRPMKETKGKRIRYNLSDMSSIDPSMGQSAEIAKIIDYTVMNHK